jgi:hypothetical protein
VFGFTHDSPALACDGVSLSAIAEAEGTPVYVYSAAVIRERYSAIDQAFGAYPHRLHYALKANSSLALARCSPAWAALPTRIRYGRSSWHARRDFPPRTSSSRASANRPPKSKRPCRWG